MSPYCLLATGGTPWGAGIPPTDPAADAVVLAASVVATLALVWHAIRQPGPHRSVYAAVALATAAAAASQVDRFAPWAAWPAAAIGVAAAAVLAVTFPRRVAAADRDRAENAARLALLEAAVGASSDGVMIAEADPDDPAGLRVVYANPAFEQITGYTVEEAAGLSPSVFCQPAVADGQAASTTDPDEEAAVAALASVRAALGGSEPARLEVPSRRKDGTRVWAEWQVVPVAGPDGRATHRVAVIRDVTERRQLETQLRESQKLEAVGRLAGGIAHDFNNLLTIIRGNAELIATTPAGEAGELVDDIRTAADRATGLVRQLLAFGRRQPARPVVLDLNEAVADMAGMLRRLLGERVAVSTVLSPAPVRARIDRGQFEQVVMNLAVNAKDAMPAGGTLTISTAAASPDGGPTRYVRVAVSDTGVGIPAGVRDKIFEPFFTTKPVGKGTGLGLATVYGIVQQAGGRVAVDSVVGAGSTFRVDLPWSDEPAQPRSAITPTPAPVSRAAAGRGRTVLLTEDEDAVRKLARVALESAGYVVHEAGNGEEALALLPVLPTIDLLVTDLTMPGVGGRELARLVRAERPGVGVVFISGYHSDIGRLDTIPGAIFLAKPFTPADLLRITGKALARMATRAMAPV